MKGDHPELRVLPPAPSVEPPPDRGQLLTADQVAIKLLSDTVSAAWVRRNVPGKISLGHSTVRWFELEVRQWLDARRTCASSVTSTHC